MYHHRNSHHLHLGTGLIESNRKEKHHVSYISRHSRPNYHGSSITPIPFPVQDKKRCPRLTALLILILALVLVFLRGTDMRDAQETTQCLGEIAFLVAERSEEHTSELQSRP